MKKIKLNSVGLNESNTLSLAEKTRITGGGYPSVYCIPGHMCPGGEEGGADYCCSTGVCVPDESYC